MGVLFQQVVAVKDAYCFRTSSVCTAVEQVVSVTRVKYMWREKLALDGVQACKAIQLRIYFRSVHYVKTYIYIVYVYVCKR
jgi:hypothetical protein